MEKKRISEIIDTWEKQGEITVEMLEIIDKRFEDIVRYELGYLDELVEKNKPHRAYGRLSRFLSFINMTMTERPSVQKQMEAYIFELRKKIDLIADGMGAKEYYFTLEMPTGISITMVFKI